MNKGRDSFIFYRSFFEAISDLDSTSRCELYDAISKYCLNFQEPELTGMSNTLWKLIKPQLDANNKRFLDGTKGGRPSKKTTGYKKVETTGYESKKPNNNVNVNDNGNVNNNVNDNDADIKSKSFKKPSKEEIALYCKERSNAIDTSRFFDYYESNGWMIGKGKMKDWKAAIRTWERNNITKDNKDKGSMIF